MLPGTGTGAAGPLCCCSGAEGSRAALPGGHGAGAGCRRWVQSCRDAGRDTPGSGGHPRSWIYQAWHREVSPPTARLGVLPQNVFSRVKRIWQIEAQICTDATTASGEPNLLPGVHQALGLSRTRHFLQEAPDPPGIVEPWEAGDLARPP